MKSSASEPDLILFGRRQFWLLTGDMDDLVWARIFFYKTFGDRIFSLTYKAITAGISLRKHPFLLALRRRGRFARRNVPRETSPSAKSEEKRMFSQVRQGISFQDFFFPRNQSARYFFLRSPIPARSPWALTHTPLSPSSEFKWSAPYIKPWKLLLGVKGNH